MSFNGTLNAENKHNEFASGICSVTLLLRCVRSSAILLAHFTVHHGAEFLFSMLLLHDSVSDD